MNRRHLLQSGLGAGLALLQPSLASASVLIRDTEADDDLSIIRESLLAIHPGLTRYLSPRQFEQEMAVLATHWTRDTSAGARYLALSRMLAKVRCGHTQCNPYNQSDAMAAALLQRPTRLPFRFAWMDRQMVVLADLGSGANLPRGTIIETVNGVGAATMLDALLPYARADGSNDGKRVAQMDMRGVDRFETFDIFQSLLFPPRDGEFALSVRAPDGTQRRVSVAAQDFATRLAQRIAPDTRSDAPLWQWEMRDDIAILTMPSWVMYNSRWDWEGWLDERLNSLSGARGLVIDLRDNEGGNECGNVILARLAERDLSFAGYDQRVRYRQTPENLRPFLDTWDPSFYRIGESAVDMGDGFFRLADVEPTDRIAASGPRISVPVAALVGPACSSATFSFARRAKESGLVRLFGTTTGGNLRGINGNGYFFVRLPQSGIEFDIPIVGNFPVVPQPDAGVEPDVAVAATVQSVAAGTDPAMEQAMQFCQSAAR